MRSDIDRASSWSWVTNTKKHSSPGMPGESSRQRVQRLPHFLGVFYQPLQLTTRSSGILDRDSAPSA